MKTTITILFIASLSLATGTAQAQVEIPCVCDREIRLAACSAGGGDGAGGMPVSPCIDYPHRAFAVFPLENIPENFASARLELVAHAGQPLTGPCQVTAIGEFGSQLPALEWDFDFRKPVFFIGELEVTTPSWAPQDPLDVTAAMEGLRQAGASYAVFKFHIPHGHSGTWISISTIENAEYGGARLVFETAVNAQAENLDGLKSLYR